MPGHTNDDAYDACMAFAATLYADAIAACITITGGASITQLGGMCLAIEIPIEGGWVWVHDTESDLPWSREDHSGWCVAVYRRASDGSEPIDGPEPEVELITTDRDVAALMVLLTTALRQFGRS